MTRYIIVIRPNGCTAAQPLPLDDERAWVAIGRLAELMPDDGVWRVIWLVGRGSAEAFADAMAS